MTDLYFVGCCVSDISGLTGGGQQPTALTDWSNWFVSPENLMENKLLDPGNVHFPLWINHFLLKLRWVDSSLTILKWEDVGPSEGWSSTERQVEQWADGAERTSCPRTKSLLYWGLLWYLGHCIRTPGLRHCVSCSVAKWHTDNKWGVYVDPPAASSGQFKSFRLWGFEGRLWHLWLVLAVWWQLLWVSE